MSSFRINLFYKNTFVPSIFRDLTDEERMIIKEDVDDFFNLPPREYTYFEITEEEGEDSSDNSYFKATFRCSETNAILPLSREQKIWFTSRIGGVNLFYNKNERLYHFEMELL